MSDLLGSASPPGALDELWSWQLRALCRGRGEELFFHPAGEREPQRGDRIRAARSVCARCPVRAACAEFALRMREPYGVWGGLSETERQDLLYGSRPPRQR